MSQDSKNLSTESQSIIIKRVKKGGHGGHHGGAWKIAYADFVTAMMAFFLLMWLLVSTKKGDLEGIAEYFKMPLRLALRGGPSVGERASVIKGGGQDIVKQDGQVKKGDINADQVAKPLEKKVPKPQEQPAPSDLKDLKTQLEKDDAVRLSSLKEKLEKAIEANPVLKQYKNQIKLEITSKGLRIQILDEQNRPMFPTGEAQLEPYMKDIIHQIAVILNQVPNKISIAGHTDATPYSMGEKSYSNWELSADRANASRRELVAAGMNDNKVIRVVGFSSSIPLDKDNPLNPINRRISIMVLNKKTEEETLKESF